MRRLLLLLTTLLLINGAFALEMSADFDSDIMVRGVDNSVGMTLSVSNASRGIYNLYTLSDLMVLPSSNFEVALDGDFRHDFVFRTRSSMEIDGKYAFTYTLNHRGVEKFDEKGIIDFVDLSDVLFIGSDSIDVSSGEVVFYIKNLEEISLYNLSADFSSNLFDVKDEFSIGPGEQIEIRVPVDAEELKTVPAGVYIVTATFDTSVGDVIIDGNLYLGEKKGITSTEDSSGLIVRTHTITKVNAGNVMEDVSIVMTKNIFSRLFTGFNVNPVSVDRDGFDVIYTFEDERLGPAEAFIVKSKTNYAIPFFVVLVGVLVIYAVKKYMDTKVEVRKSVVPMRTKNGEFALRVELSVKARYDVDNLKLSDRIPVMVKLYKKFGATQPDGIDSKVRRLYWNVGELKAGEERAFSYVVYSKVGIVGKFILPEAHVSFDLGEKKLTDVSNKVFFMADQK